MLPESDVVFQFGLCLSADFRNRIKATVTSGFQALTGDNVRSFFSAPYFASECVSSNERGLFWHALSPPRPSVGPPPQTTVRGGDSPATAFIKEVSQVLSDVSILSSAFGGEAGFGVLFKRDFLTGLATAIWQDRWQSNPTRRLGGDLKPDPNGPVQINTFELTFTSTNSDTVTLTVFGSENGINFSISHSETIGVRTAAVSANPKDTAGLLTITSSSPNLSLESGVVPTLWFFASLAEATAFGVPAGALQAEQYAESKFGPLLMPTLSDLPTLLLPLIELLPHKEYLAATDAAPHGRKLVFSYAKVRIDQDGLFLGAGVAEDGRYPSVTISGPQAILLDEIPPNGLVTMQFQALTDDMRANKDGTFTSISWAGSTGTIEAADPQRKVNPQVVNITFDLRGRKPIAENVAVTVIDADGNQASNTLAVPIRQGDTPPHPIGKVLGDGNI